MLRELYFRLKTLLILPLYKLKKVKVQTSNRIERGVFLSKTEIGSYNYIGHYTIIDNAVIGNYCSIAAHTMIGGGEHDYTFPSTSYRLAPKSNNKKKTRIENDVWIGTKVTIREGVTIHTGAIIGAHSLVIEDVPAYSIVFGIPAKHYKYRFPKDLQEKILETQFWLDSPKVAQNKLLKLQTT